MKIKIEKLGVGGQGIGYVDGKEFRVWGALPDEEVMVGSTLNRKNYAEGFAEKIIRPVSHRKEPTVDYYLISCPWQIMPAEKELEFKKKIACELFEEALGGSTANLAVEPPEILQNDKHNHYRSKMEFFFAGEPGNLSLALLNRGRKSKFIIEDSILSGPSINEAAKEILEWANEQKIPEDSINSVLIRGNRKGGVLAGLFVKTSNLAVRPPSWGEFSEHIKGFYVYYSKSFESVSIPEKLLHHSGEHDLCEKLLDVSFKYGLLSFFQVNITFFEKTLSKMGEFLGKDDEVVDFYSGVGTIGLSLADKFKEGILVESNEDAARYAEQNIKENGIKNCRAVHARSEEALEYIKSDKVVIFDPPRPGLHKKVSAQILKEKPKRIIYLSCGIESQARDLGLLKEAYKPIFWELYNYFPQTPHVESLVVLDRL